MILLVDGKPDKPATLEDYPTALKAIRAKCLDCSGGNVTEVRLCPIKRCPLYLYRSGKTPEAKKRKMSEEQKKKVAERFAAYRKAKKEQSDVSSTD